MKKRTIITASFVLATIVTFCLVMARQDALETTAGSVADCNGYGYSYSYAVGDGTYGYSYGYSSNVALSKEEIIAKIEAAQTRTLRSKEEIIAKIEAAQTRTLRNDIAGVPAYADPTDLTEEEKEKIEETKTTKYLERPLEKEIPAYYCLSNNIAGVPAYEELSAEYSCNLPTYEEGPVSGTTEEGIPYMIW